MYILWRTTRDDIWRRRGWEMFEAVEKWTRTDSGYASLVSVLATKNPKRTDTGMARYVYLTPVC
jgi:mannosyl-oligosaccharide alpha-1,2-mannosidase